MLIHAMLPTESKEQRGAFTSTLETDQSFAELDRAVEKGLMDLATSTEGVPAKAGILRIPADHKDEDDSDDGGEHHDFFNQLAGMSIIDEGGHGSPSHSPPHQPAPSLPINRRISEPDTSSMLQGLQPSDILAIASMRAWLRDRGFDPSSDEHQHDLTDAYILSSLTQLKDNKPRPFDYTAAKLLSSLQWRAQYGAPRLRPADAARALAPGHMRWDGADRFGRPILYVRPALMDLATYDRDEYVRAHVVLLEEGLRRMPAGVTRFLLVADAAGLGMRHLDAGLMRDLLRVATVGYPDRLGLLLVGPVNTVVRCAWAGLSRLMPRGLSAKITMTPSLRAALQPLLPAGAAPPPWMP